MHAHRFDVGDDALLRRFHAIVEAAGTHERPWSPMWSFEELAAMFRQDDSGLRREVLAVFDGADAMVGAGFAVLPQDDNPDKVYGGVFVEPALRRRGIGRALVGELAALARREGRSQVLVDSGIPFEGRDDHPYRRFADALGFRLACVEVHRVLDLPVPLAQLTALRDECAPRHAGYELRTFHDGIPDELLGSYCELANQLAVEAPTGEVEFEAEAMTPELWRQRQQRFLDSGRHRLNTLALTASGEVVAHTELVVPRADLPKVYQWHTLVRRDHRGHRLGAAVKVQNLLALQERYPDRRSVHTTNEETNAAMVGINDRLGFRPVEICPEFLLEVR